MKYICATNKIIYINNLLGIQDIFGQRRKGKMKYSISEVRKGDLYRECLGRLGGQNNSSLRL